MTDTRPIGVFDSGVGGLSVLHEIRQRLPQEALIYCADSGYAPYGGRDPEEICARSLVLSGFLMAQGCKALVVACNTATAAAGSVLRERYPAVPVIGMEPAVKPATAATRTGVVGVLATVGTLASARFAALLDTFGQEVTVLTQPCPGLMECVERGELDTPATRALLASYVAPLIDGGADVLVLGCTHYVFLREAVQQLVGSEVRLIDTGAAVAAQLQRKLIAGSALRAAGSLAGPPQFWLSQAESLPERAGLERMNATLQTLWGEAAGFSVLPT